MKKFWEMFIEGLALSGCIMVPNGDALLYLLDSGRRNNGQGNLKDRSTTPHH